MNLLQSLVLGLLAITLIACSSGGGKGGKPSTSSAGGGASFTVSASAINLQADMGAITTPSQTVTVKVSGVTQGLYYLLRQSFDGIQLVGMTLTTDTIGTLTVTGQPSNLLKEGIYNDWVELLLCYDIDCRQHLSGSPFKISVSYQVTDEFTIVSNPLEFHGSAGVDWKQTDTIQITGTKSRWTAQSDSDWLTLSQTSGAGPAAVGIQANPTGLGIGAHQAAILFYDSVSDKSYTISAYYNLSAPPFYASVNSRALEMLSFRGSSAQDIASQPLTINLSTTSPMPWRLSEDTSSWIKVSPASGILEGVNIATQDVEVTLEPDDLSDGQYSAELNFIAEINGSELRLKVPVSLILEPAVIQAERVAVAFTETNGVSHLTDVVRIRKSRNLPLDWSAVVAQAEKAGWLSIAKMDDRLILTADAEGLNSGMYYASVVLTFDDALEEDIQVGLYVNRDLEPEDTATHFIGPRDGYTDLVSDPLRPYVYYTDQTATITAVNQYTGETEFTLNNMGGNLRGMTISPDGSTLFALDHANQSIARADLKSRSVLSELKPSGFGECDSCLGIYTVAQIASVRVGRETALVTGRMQVIDPDTGVITAPVTNQEFPTNRLLAISGNGSVAFSADSNSAGHQIYRHLLALDTSSNLISATLTEIASQEGFARTISTDYSGEKLYKSCNYNNRSALTFSGRSLAPLFDTEDGSGSGAKVVDDNRLLCAMYFDISGYGPKLWELDLSSNHVVAEYQFAGEIKPRSFIVSGDGRRVIVRTEDGTLHFLKR